MMARADIARLLLVLALLPCAAGSQTPSDRKPPAMVSIPGFAPEELAPVAPTVVCAGDQVSVEADNSTLRDVLNAIAHCAGATVDMPAAVGAMRVVARIGPATPRDVLAALLDGSLDYVIAGSERDPASARLVTVRPHQSLPTVYASSAVPPRAISQRKSTTFVDQDGVERLLSGLTPEEAQMSPQELAEKFERAREEQKRFASAPPNSQ